MDFITTSLTWACVAIALFWVIWSDRARPIRVWLNQQAHLLRVSLMRDRLMRRALRAALRDGYLPGSDDSFEFLAATRDVYLEDLEEMFSTQPDSFEQAALLAYGRIPEVARLELPLPGIAGASLRMAEDPTAAILRQLSPQYLPTHLRDRREGRPDFTTPIVEEIRGRFGPKPDLPLLAAIVLFLEETSRPRVTPIFELRDCTGIAQNWVRALSIINPATGRRFISKTELMRASQVI